MLSNCLARFVVSHEPCSAPVPQAAGLAPLECLSSAHLQGVCCYLVGQANAAALLLQVDDDPAASLLNVLHG